MIPFVFDTSALLSLESINLLDIVLANFQMITSLSVLQELEDFAVYDDTLGRIAKRALEKKERLTVLSTPSPESISFVSKTDNELFQLAQSQQLSLITDDIKLRRHCAGRIVADFSTIFLLIFVDAGVLSKDEAISKLEKLRVVRNWQDNIIYIATKELLDNI